ncbi:hypothetical protein AHAS_Ahas15G0285300 [Arachis hypogaea]
MTCSTLFKYIRVRGIANALRKQAHEAPGNHAFLPGWAQGQQSAASPVVDSSFLTDSIGCSQSGVKGFEPLHVDSRTNRKPLNLEVGLEERVVQEHEDIATRDSNIIETDDKLSALFACNAFTYQSWRMLL